MSIQWYLSRPTRAHPFSKPRRCCGGRFCETYFFFRASLMGNGLCIFFKATYPRTDPCMVYFVYISIVLIFMSKDTWILWDPMGRWLVDFVWDPIRMVNIPIPMETWDEVMRWQLPKATLRDLLSDMETQHDGSDGKGGLLLFNGHVWYLPWAPKTMKNKGFGHLKTRLFAINTSKNVGSGGPWYRLHVRFLGTPKTMKNKGFGHLKTRLFAINTSKNVGSGGPWYRLHVRFLGCINWNAFNFVFHFSIDPLIAQKAQISVQIPRWNTCRNFCLLSNRCEKPTHFL